MCRCSYILKSIRFIYSSVVGYWPSNQHESFTAPLTNHCTKSPPHTAAFTLGQLLLLVHKNTLTHTVYTSVSHYQSLICLLAPGCQSYSKFPGSHYIWHYFISDLRISERISVQAQSLAWKRCSVWKAKGLHHVGSHFPRTQTFFFFQGYTLAFSFLHGFVDLAVECLSDTTLANSSRS